MSTPNTPTTNTTKTAYAYSRFSTVQQADGDSKRRQESLTRAWPEASDYEIKYLHDAGISAYSGRNRTIGQFGVFLASLRSGRLGVRPVLLVENLDRISREELETAQALFLEIVGLGATIITLHNGKRYAKGMGLVDIITALVEMDVAHQHSAKLSMRVKAAVEARMHLVRTCGRGALANPHALNRLIPCTEVADFEGAVSESAPQKGDEWLPWRTEVSFGGKFHCAHRRRIRAASGSSSRRRTRWRMISMLRRQKELVGLCPTMSPCVA